MITLQFVSDDTLGADLIGWYTRSLYTHVDAIMPGGGLLGARIKGGVQSRPPDYRTFTRCARFTTTLSPEAENRFYGTLVSQLGKPYDWTGIVGFIADRDWRDPSHWYCSELIAWAFEQAGRPLLRIDNLDRVTPRDLTTSLLITPA